VELFLIALAVAAAYVISLWVWPFRPCPRCQGKGTNRGSNRRRFGNCRRCQGSKAVQRIGSKAVHRAVRSLIAYRDKEK
jgi:DnaJ-class molecular chaperone